MKSLSKKSSQLDVNSEGYTPKRYRRNSKKETQRSLFDQNLDKMRPNIEQLVTAIRANEENSTELKSALTQLGDIIEEIETHLLHDTPMFVSSLFTLLKHITQSPAEIQQISYRIKQFLLIRFLQQASTTNSNTLSSAPILIRIFKHEFTVFMQADANCGGEIFSNFKTELKEHLENYNHKMIKSKLEYRYHLPNNSLFHSTPQPRQPSTTLTLRETNLRDEKTDFLNNTSRKLFSFINEPHPIANCLNQNISLILDCGNLCKQPTEAANLVNQYLYLILEKHILVERPCAGNEALDHRGTMLHNILHQCITEILHTRTKQDKMLTVPFNTGSEQLPSKSEKCELEYNKANNLTA